MSKLPANRVIVILHAIFIIAMCVGLFVAYVNNSLPHSWQPAVAVALPIVTAVAGGTAVVIKYLSGSQAVDQQQHEQVLLTQQHAHELKLAQAKQPEPEKVSTGGWTFGPVDVPTPGHENVPTSALDTTGQVADAEPDSSGEAGPAMVSENLDTQQWLANRHPDQMEKPPVEGEEA